MSYDELIVQYRCEANEIHIIPINDLRGHEHTESCWCKPNINKYGTYIHHAMDGRVEYETGERKLS